MASTQTSYVPSTDVQRVKTIVNRLIDHVAISGDPQSKHLQFTKETLPVLRPRYVTNFFYEMFNIDHVVCRMNVYECLKSNMVVATLELPGLPKSSITVNMEGSQLIVSGERWPDHKKQEHCRSLVSELRYGKFVRVIPLSSSFDVRSFL